MKTIKQRILSCLLVACMIATFVPTFSIPAGAALTANQAIYSVNVEDDGVTNNVIVAEYNGKSYVMGPIKADGTAEAIPAVKRNAGGDNIVVDETTAELFTVSSQRYKEGNSTSWVYSLLTKDGYIANSYSITDEYDHKLIKAKKDSISPSLDFSYFWEYKDAKTGLNNLNTRSYRICLVVNGSNMYFALVSGTPDEGVKYEPVKIYHKSCQHPNMEHVPAVAHALYPTQITHVHSKPGKPAKRLLIAFSPIAHREYSTHTFYIESEDSPRSEEYKALTKEFYL